MKNAIVRNKITPKIAPIPIPAFAPEDRLEDGNDEEVGGDVEEAMDTVELDVVLLRSDACQLICMRGA